MQREDKPFIFSSYEQPAARSTQTLESFRRDNDGWANIMDGMKTLPRLNVRLLTKA